MHAQANTGQWLLAENVQKQPVIINTDWGAVKHKQINTVQGLTCTHKTKQSACVVKLVSYSNSNNSSQCQHSITYPTHFHSCLSLIPVRRSYDPNYREVMIICMGTITMQRRQRRIGQVIRREQDNITRMRPHWTSEGTRQWGWLDKT